MLVTITFKRDQKFEREQEGYMGGFGVSKWEGDIIKLHL